MLLRCRRVLNSFGVKHHQYADNTQIYISASKSDLSEKVDVLRHCPSLAAEQWSTTQVWLNTIIYIYVSVARFTIAVVRFSLWLALSDSS